MQTSARVATAVSFRGHGLASAGFLASVGLLLLTVVEMRRAFFFPMSDYLKLGGPSPVLYFDPRHLPLLAIGGLGAWMSYRGLRGLGEDLRSRGGDLSRLVRLLGVALLGLLIVDLFIYRGVPASRIVAAGKTGVGQAIPMELFSGWLRPLGEGINYMALVWHATILGILIGALFLTLVASFLKRWIGGRGFKSHLAGSLLALGHPFCSCCAAPVGASLFRRGASLGSTLAFVVSSPMLNITSLILAASLLPLDFALLRIIGGLAVGVLVTYLVSVIAAGWVGKTTASSAPNKAVELSSRVLDGFSRWFRFEVFLEGKAVDSPGALIAAWLGMAWRLGRVVVPVLFVGSVVASAMVMALPSPTNGVPGIIAAAAFGTLLMVPTWTEIPIALSLLREGLAGPAAALLITLPAVSVPCLVIVGAGTASYRAAALLGAFVFGVGALAGVWFAAF
ncbi:MAG: permease [Dehalococcoidia bacterium]|nr:permease [Dehalococcoidia bacterium]